MELKSIRPYTGCVERGDRVRSSGERRGAADRIDGVRSGIGDVAVLIALRRAFDVDARGAVVCDRRKRRDPVGAVVIRHTVENEQPTDGGDAAIVQGGAQERVGALLEHDERRQRDVRLGVRVGQAAQIAWAGPFQANGVVALHDGGNRSVGSNRNWVGRQ